MSDFRFADASYVYLMWTVLLFAVVVLLLDRRTSNLLRRFLSPLMQSRLVSRAHPVRRMISLLLLTAGLGCLVLALMRPQWGATYREVPKVGAQIMVCLDVSRSMLAEDTAPNRLERAKLELDDLLSFLDEDRVGLIGFAGRAAVLCPMTNDFGFLRLILDNVGPNSVGRGGTRLEEPIRKAINGFDDSSDAAKVILLITDGEDLDSFPMEAAREAREKGVSVIAIGFGDENGSRIEITDPRTGVRSFVRDENGKEVTTRLDGDTLREIALTTEGVYIPAGTGVLDLDSIYTNNIRPLMRGKLESKQQAIRNEGYQLPLLLGLILIVLGVVSGSSSLTWPVIGEQPTNSTAAALLPLVASLTWPLSASAQTSQQPPVIQSRDASDDAPEPTRRTTKPSDSTEPGTNNSKSENINPRETYNIAIRRMQKDPDGAEELLLSARRHARADGEVRFRSSYNLGWVSVIRADDSLESNPQEALQELEAAAGWFREAVRLNPKSDPARHNLEIVLRRILELSDSLQEKDERDYAKVLDQLIVSQRQIVQGVAELTERLNNQPIDKQDIADREFRRLAVEQRQVLSDTHALAERAGQGIQALQNKDKTSLTQEEAVESVQLAGVLKYVERAAQRMGQSRSQLRFKEAERGHRRAAIALAELKRARDQIRDPAEVLRLLLADAGVVARRTSLLGTIQGTPTGLNNLPAPPSWLTLEFVSDSQLTITQRTEEIAGQLEAMFSDENIRANAASGEESLSEHQTEKFREAPKLVRTASAKFAKADDSIGKSELRLANQQQISGMKSLKDAVELFLDLRGLIELTYATENRIKALLETGETASIESLSGLAEITVALQQQDLNRAAMIRSELQSELQRLAELQEDQSSRDQTSGSSTSPAVDAEAEKERFEFAVVLIDSAVADMARCEQLLQQVTELAAERLSDSANLPDSPSTTADEVQSEPNTKAEPDDRDTPMPGPIDKWLAATQANSRALEDVSELRRLFFSIAELVRETAERQANLNDETSQLELEQDSKTLVEKLSPLTDRQSELATLSSQISDGLLEQARASTQTAAANSGDEASRKESERRYNEAAALVGEARDHMNSAVSMGNDEPTPIKNIRTEQDTALEKLIEAVELLVPPDQQDSSEQNQQEQQSEQETGNQQETESTPDANENSENMAANQLLQMVRDREAQRREQKSRNQATGREPVLRDW